MEEVDRLLARFGAAVAAGRIRCDDVEDVRSGAGSGDLDQAVDRDRQRPAREPATVARAREQWAAGQRIVAARTWREATGGSLEEAMAALEQV
ncbi:MAG: hypothetical protein VYE22_14875 [Myxococcota bacterium]|nr:hypothetical protein [Myxococcota bacterium]